MSKTASIRTIEQAIESLPQSDQFKLLEKLLKQIKHSLTGGKPSTATRSTSGAPATLRGSLRQYVDHSLRDAEKDAFSKAMKEKHAHS